MSEKLILYNLNMSPPVRSCKIVAQLLDLELEIRDVDMFNGEHLKEPYISMNPEHTVPLLDDNGDLIWDSHAISTYLVDKYSTDDSLYPKDLYLRARVNQRLFFDNGVLFARFRIISKHIFGGGTSIPDEMINSVHEAYDLLEIFLNSGQFLVGDQLTLADISACVTTTVLACVVPLTEERYPNITAWIGRVKEAVPFFDEMNEEFVIECSEFITAKMESNKEAE